MKSTPKKVLIIGPAWPLRGGLSTYDQILAAELMAMGHEVSILTFKLQYPSLLFPGKTQYSKDPAPKGLNIDVKMNSINPINWIKTGLEYRDKKYDLVIVRYWLPFMALCLGTIARLIKKNKVSRIVAITDNVLPHEKRIGDKLFTWYFLKACHGFVAMSQNVLADLKRFEKHKPAFYNPHPIYNSFKPSVTKAEACEILKLDPKKHFLLFFGFIRAYKGLDLLLEAFAKSSRGRLNLKLIVAGEFYEDEKPYKDLVKQLNIGDDVIFYSDFIPDSEVHLYFSLADMIVQPYKDATQSGVTQVAYFYNKPMIVTNTGGLPELVPNEQAGFVVEKDSDSIAKAIHRFYDENRAESMKAFVEQEKGKYSWDKMIESLWKASQQK